DGDQELCHPCSRPFQAEGWSAQTGTEEDAALLSLAEVAVDWLPPPTPPPPEARRRRRRAKSPPPSPTSPQSTRTIRVCAAQTSPPSYARSHATGRSGQGSPREKPMQDEGGHCSLDSRDCNLLIDRDRRSTESEKARGEKCSGDDEGSVAAITLRAAGDRSTDRKGKGGSQDSLRENRHRQETGKKMATAGAWAGSYEGSVAKRRADGILARVAALESYFDRVEEQAVPAPLSSSA
ncbi:unnamed protein product, partial [Hapterophycus canaliculatus]